MVQVKKYRLRNINYYPVILFMMNVRLMLASGFQALKSNIKQSSVTQQSQGTLDAPSHLDSASEYYPSEKKTETKVCVPSVTLYPDCGC